MCPKVLQFPLLEYPVYDPNIAELSLTLYARSYTAHGSI